MSYSNRLRTYNPDELSKRREHERNGDVEFVLNCWSCKEDFWVWIGLGNLHASIFNCDKCGAKNEID